MAGFIPWNSQPLDEWSKRHAPGQLVEIDGRVTHYVQRGQGPPAILIHGFFIDWYTWAHNLDALARHRTVYALDLWGFGGSSREPLDWGYPLYAAQVLRFMDALGIERAALAGHSMGGGTAIHLAVRHPARVERLLLVDAAGMPHGLPLRSRLFNLPRVAEFLMGLNSDAFRRKNLTDLWFHPGFALSQDDFDHLVRFHKVRGTTECLTTILRRKFFHTLGDEIPRLGRLDVPITIVWGREDRAIPLERGEAMHRALPRSRLEILDRCGHTPCFERPDEFNRLAVDVLRPAG